MSFEHYYEVIYKALEPAGEGGLTVGKIAKAIKHSKSLTWNALQEMVSQELIKRTENYDQTEYRQVRYHYFQLPLFDESSYSNQYYQAYDGWDGLRGCEKCGNDATGRLCHSCQRQEMIDDAIPPQVWMCDECGAANPETYLACFHCESGKPHTNEGAE